MKSKQLILLLFALVVGMGNARAQEPERVTLDKLTVAYGTQGDWDKVANLSYPLDVTNAVIFGSDAGAQTTNANLNDYDYLYVTVTDFTTERAVRIFFWDNLQNKRLDYYLKPLAEKETADFTVQTAITANGTYCVKIPDGARLQGAKAPWGAAADVAFKFSEIYLTKRASPYVELVPYTLVYSDGKAVIPFSESHIRATGNVSVNYTTGEVTNTGTGDLIIYLNKEDLVGATLYHADIEGNLEPVLNVTDADNGEVGGIYNSRYDWYISADNQRKNKVGAVTALKYHFEKTGTMTFKSIYIQANLMVAGTTVKNLTDMSYGSWGAPANTISQYVSNDSYKTNNIGKSVNDVLYGHDANSDAHKYVDLTNCSKITFTGQSENGVIRLFYNWSGTAQDKPIEVISDFPKTDGTYVFDIDAFKKKKNLKFFHLNGIKTQGASVKLTEVTVAEYTNTISGSGINKAAGLLANPYNTYIDATGLTNTSPIELTSANPNCIIKSEEGKLSNAKNVMVGTTIANLALTDKNPFAVPAGATAENASYDRTFTAEYSTVCLPFAATFTGTAYEFTSQDGTEVTFTKVDALTAGKAYLVGNDFAVTGGSGALTDVDKSSDFQGTYTQQVLNTGYGFGEGNFVQCNGATLNPFRAYLNIAGNAGVKEMNVRFGGEETAITDMAEAINSAKAIYGVNGVRQHGLQKGINIIKMANGETRKVIIK